MSNQVTAMNEEQTMDLYLARLRAHLAVLYPGEDQDRIVALIQTLDDEFSDLSRRAGAGMITPAGSGLSERDTMLITYGDSLTRPGEKPLATLNRFLLDDCDQALTHVHLLPIFPSTSDDGFSVSDYETIDPTLGSWDDVIRLGQSFGLMIDAVINHTSQHHRWFKRCLQAEHPFTNYYIASDPAGDYSAVTRPRALPLLTPFQTAEGEKWYWTTFSSDQVDLNYASPELIREVLRVLLQYIRQGARFLRLDAIGFAWKKPGTTCMHLPETHALIKLMRLVIDHLYPGTCLVTETNVPHLDNISYLGHGDEAHLVYQFPLPPLTLFSLVTGDARPLTAWAQSLDEFTLPPGTTFFNFLASHDGIGVRPLDGLLADSEKQRLFYTVLDRQGRISYKTNPDGSTSPYELNINYFDALTDSGQSVEQRIQAFLAAQAIMLSLKGLPGVYIHSLVGSRNWLAGVEASGINRRINREKLDLDQLHEALDSDAIRRSVFAGMKHLLKLRASLPAFHPEADQRSLDLGAALFAVERFNRVTGDRLKVIINVRSSPVELAPGLSGRDRISDSIWNGQRLLAPYQICWLEETT